MNFRPEFSSYEQPASVVGSSAVSAFLWATYRWMALGLSLTAMTAWWVANTPAVSLLLLQNPMIFYGLLIGEFAMVIAFSRMVHTATPAAAASMFLGYAFLNGLTLSVLFTVYTQTSITQAFMVSAATFGVLSVYGAVTKRDLTPVGHFMHVGLIGFVVASLINMFMQSPAVYWVSTYAGILIFAGLTAYDNQRLKKMYISYGGAGNLAINGALMLYLDFINMFLLVLRFFDNRR